MARRRIASDNDHQIITGYGSADLARRLAEADQADRGWPDADWQEWVVRKSAAAAAARQYAQGLRAEAASMSENDRPSEARIREAEKVPMRPTWAAS